MKITEIRVTAGKDVILIEPRQGTWVIGGKSGNLPEKLAMKLFKAVAGSAEDYFDLLRGAKETDFKS